MDADRRSHNVLWLKLVVLWLVLVTFGMTAGPAAASDADDLSYGTWRLESPLGTVSGPCLFVGRLAEGTPWRCEIAVAEDGNWPTRSMLLERRGRGWTLTGGPDGGFVQPWSEPWRELGAEASDSVAQLLRRWIWWGEAQTATGAVTGARPHRWRPARPAPPVPIILNDWTGLPAAWRPPTSGASDAGRWRRRLTSRGTGNGGDGLVLSLAGRDGVLTVTSSRWPGRITIEEQQGVPVTLPEEAFLPLWPLAEFLDQ